ncbi:hypothetical protein BaRGS_00012977 [Batillaria attramentaria]|uniref:CARD domain-containing protein n=1 Tax=Batillaria attramentaria TaxID=370345 RepID=A0ABD0L8R6_9CAEN
MAGTEKPVSSGERQVEYASESDDSSDTVVGDLIEHETPEFEQYSSEVNIFDDPEEVMKFIRIKFKECIDPIECGLTDILRQENAISTDEEEEVKKKLTRRDKAWAAWDILCRLSPRLFDKVCMPFLKENFPHVVRGVEFRWNGQTGFRSKCPRHFIQDHIKLKKFVDILLSCACWTYKRAQGLLEGKASDRDKWSSIFETVKKNSGNAQLQKEVLKALKGIGVENPHSFLKLFRSGFRCMCKKAATTPSQEKHFHLVPKAEDTVSNSSPTLYPAETDSDGQVFSADIESTVVSTAENNGHITKTDAAEPELFQTREDKAKFERLLEKTNKALVDAATAKTYIRQIEGAAYRWIMLNGGTVEEQTLKNKIRAVSRSQDDIAILAALEDQTQCILKTFQAIFLSTENTMAETKYIRQGRETFNFKVPDFPYRALLERHHKLFNDLNEITGSKNQFHNATDATSGEFTLHKFASIMFQNDSSFARFGKRKVNECYTEQTGALAENDTGPAEHNTHPVEHDTLPTQQVESGTRPVEHDTPSIQRVENDTHPVEQVENDIRPSPAQEAENDTPTVAQAENDTRLVEQVEKDTCPVQQLETGSRPVEQVTNDRHTLTDEREVTERSEDSAEEMEMSRERFKETVTDRDDHYPVESPWAYQPLAQWYDSLWENSPLIPES